MRAVGEISPDECRALLETFGTGRAVHTHRALPAVTVVDYTVAGDVLLFLVQPQSSFAHALHDSVIGFHVESVGLAGDNGWSVTVFGPARRVRWPGPPGTCAALGVTEDEVDEVLFGLSLAHLRGQRLRRTAPLAAQAS